MNKTTHYQLCQWDAEDRILRLDFNADNAALDTALKQLADALNAESSARSATDQSLRSDFTAADATIRSEFSAADTKLRTDFTAADTKLRTDLTAADTQLRSENMLVKLADITTTSAAGQVNVPLSSYNPSAYTRLVALVDLKCESSARCMIRVNGLSASYGFNNNAGMSAAGWVSVLGTTDQNALLRNGVGEITLYQGNGYICIRAESMLGSTTNQTNTACVAASSLTQLNLIGQTYGQSDVGSKQILAGSRIRVYGWK